MSGFWGSGFSGSIPVDSSAGSILYRGGDGTSWATVSDIPKFGLRSNQLTGTVGLHGEIDSDPTNILWKMQQQIKRLEIMVLKEIIRYPIFDRVWKYY